METDRETNSKIAQTILAQMGGANRLKVMIGAKNLYAIERGLQFQWPTRSGPNAVRITLANDEYTAEFYRKAKSVQKIEHLQNADLIRHFESVTGLALRL